MRRWVVNPTGEKGQILGPGRDSEGLTQELMMRSAQLEAILRVVCVENSGLRFISTSCGSGAVECCCMGSSSGDRHVSWGVAHLHASG